MVANLSSHKRGWDHRWEEFSRWAERGQALQTELLRLVDEDTEAFNRVLAATALPRSTAGEQAARAAALEEATRGAIDVPYRVMKAAFATFELLAAMAAEGSPASASDAGVGALCARSAVLGAWLNVRTNVPGLRDQTAVAGILADGIRIAAEAVRCEGEIQRAVEAKIGR
jgi:glutamate formiminotransferase/formiminotetrahydrofolate cyclodeaminase